MSDTPAPLKVVVIGLGQMGISHALSYHHNPGFEIVGLLNRSQKVLSNGLEQYHITTSLDDALKLKPDLVSINTQVDSHAEYAISAMEAGCHVFVEKPLAKTIVDAERIVATAKKTGRKLIIGYILRHHPSWIRFIKLAREMGPPYVFRMNLNQQSSGPAWEVHKKLLKDTSPVVDCGVHYLDVMLQITDSNPVQVRGMGVRLSDEIDEDQVNYGHLQVIFEDGSVGWYEAGWGPMISDTAYFVKDVMGPNGSVSIVGAEGRESADVDEHTKTSKIKIHRADDGKKELIAMDDEPNHQALCDLEQQHVLDVIRKDLDLSNHWTSAIRSQAVVLAADRSMKDKKAIDL